MGVIGTGRATCRQAVGAGAGSHHACSLAYLHAGIGGEPQGRPSGAAAETLHPKP